MERGNRLLRIVDRWLGIPLLAAVNICRKLQPRASHCAIEPNIGLLCLGAIGDLLLLAPLINGIRERLPRGRIQLITSRANRGAIPLLRNVDSSFSCPVTRPMQLISHIRRQNFDLLIDTGQWARISALLSAASNAVLTVGFRTPGQYRHGGYDIAVRHSACRHEAENFLALGQALWPGLNGTTRLNLPEWRKNGDNIFCHMFPAPGAGRYLKQWPAPYWKALIRNLIKKGWHVFLTGSKTDALLCKTFIDSFFSGEASINSLAGELTLSELGEAFSGAAAVVSVNTGIMHLAALSGAPTIGLHGATDPKRWGPVGQRALSLVPRQGQHSYLNLGFEYPPGTASAMRFLTVGDVLRAIEKLALSPRAAAGAFPPMPL